MKKFLLRLLLFCLAPLPVLYGLAYMVDTGLRRSNHYFYSEWNDLFAGRVNADMLIMGSSRAWVQISPAILDSALRLNSYNLGMDGTPFRLQYERLKIYLRHNRKPKYILQEVASPVSLLYNNALNAPQQYLPYLSDTSIWRIVTHNEPPFENTDRYFPLYKYNNELPLVKEGLRSFFGRGVKSAKYKGYMGKDLPWDGTYAAFKADHPDGYAYNVDTPAIALFAEYLNYCKANDIKVLFVFPPVYYDALRIVTNREEVFGLYNRWASVYDLPFYNYRNDSMNYSTDNFYNSQHMNRAAAERFTRDLATRINADIQRR